MFAVRSLVNTGTCKIRKPAPAPPWAQLHSDVPVTAHAGPSLFSPTRAQSSSPEKTGGQNIRLHRQMTAGVQPDGQTDKRLTRGQKARQQRLRNRDHLPSHLLLAAPDDAYSSILAFVLLGSQRRYNISHQLQRIFHIHYRMCFMQ